MLAVLPCDCACRGRGIVTSASIALSPAGRSWVWLRPASEYPCISFSLQRKFTVRVMINVLSLLYYVHQSCFLRWVYYCLYRGGIFPSSYRNVKCPPETHLARRTCEGGSLFRPSLIQPVWQGLGHLSFPPITVVESHTHCVPHRQKDTGGRSFCGGLS